MRLLFSFLIVFLFSNLYAQDTKSQAILDKLSLKINNYKTFYVEFTALIKNTSTGQNDNTIGKGWVKGDKYFATYGVNSVISNGLKHGILQKMINQFTNQTVIIQKRV